MVIIKTKADLKRLETCPAISPDYHNLVELYFLQLVDALCPLDGDPEKYSLEDDGYIVVLECSDDPHNLQKFGLPLGLVNSYPGPEWSELHELADGTRVHQLAYLLDNDFMMFYYLDDGLWHDDPIMQQFLREQAEYGEIFKHGGDC